MKSKMTFSMRTFLPFVFVLLCDPKAASSAINSDGFSLVNKNQKPYEAVPYVEYFKDHEISEKQARENLRGMQERDFQTPAHCKKCSNEHMRYCHSENLLKDHCCCNQSHQKEQLYFIPHTCFVNEDRCYPSLGSCLTVMEIRNCCCDAQLKRHWRSVLSDANARGLSKHCLLVALLVAVLRWLTS